MDPALSQVAGLFPGKHALGSFRKEEQQPKESNERLTVQSACSPQLQDFPLFFPVVFHKKPETNRMADRFGFSISFSLSVIGKHPA